MIPPPEIKELTFRDYVDIVFKRKWTVIALIAVITGLVSFYDFSSPKIYEAKATLLIDRDTPNISNTGEDIYTTRRDDEYYQTQYNLLESRSLAERVLENLNLKRDPAFIASNDPVGMLLEKVDIRPVRASNLVEIAVRGRDPLKATDIANAWGREFINQDIDKRVGTAAYGVSWLEGQLDETLQKLQTSEKELNQFIRKNRIVTVPDIDDKKESLLESLKKEKANVEQLIAEARKRYKHKHPKMIALNAQWQSIEGKLQSETDEFLALQEKMVEYQTLKRKVDSYKSVYNDLLKRSKELDVSKELTISNMRVIDQAQVPEAPVKPQPKRDIALAFLGSCFLSVCLCFFLEYIDSTLKTSEDVEFYTKLPFLGYIPSERKGGKPSERDLLTHLKPYARLAEAFRNVRVSLLFSSPEDRPLKRIVVTSSIPREGKSFVSCNLATVFAQAKGQTLIIDADMRKGRLAKSFDIKAKHGLSSVLAGVCSFDEAVISTPIPNLTLLPCGSYTPNPTELLNSEKLQGVLRQAEQKFSRIIIDAPPVLSVADALILADNSDGLIFVIRAGFTSLRYIGEAKKILEKKVKIVGAILNSVDLEKDRSYYYHYYYPAASNKT